MICGNQLQILLQFYLFLSVFSQFHPVSVDYYWKDFDGVIPPDAVQGGLDKAGRQAFIGQGYFAGHGILPATIYENNRSACASVYTKTICSTEYAKILCTNNITSLSWIMLDNKQTSLLTNCGLVVGGTESGYVLYIGRIRQDRETIIGKIFPTYVSYSALFVPYNATSEASYQRYEVLTHNCNVNQFNLTTTPAHLKYNEYPQIE